MHRTYRPIAEEDATLDRALRDAQLSMIRGRGAAATNGESTRAVGALARSGAAWSHPFYWAGFQLYGDPQ
jgi:CHAT domain-containing protein